MRLTLAEAILGAKVVIPTIDCGTSLKVPPARRTGDRRVMQSRGVPDTRRGAGHQYVHFEVLIPQNLSARGKELVAELAEEVEAISDADRSSRTKRF